MDDASILRSHIIRDEAKKRTMNVRYFRTNEIAAEILTKGLHAEQFTKLKEMTELKNMIQNEEEC